MCNETIGPKEASIAVYTTGTRYTWTTGWVLVHGMAAVDAQIDLRNIVGNFQGKPCYQTAAVLPEYPDSPTVFSAGSYANSAGKTMWRETLSLTGKFWIRFGIAASNSSGVSLGSADTQLLVTYARCAEQVGLTTITVNPGMISGTDTNVYEVGAWRPTIGFSEMMGALVVMNNVSTYLETMLVCRTAQDTRAPNDWQTCETGWDNPSAGNSVRNTGALSAPAGANMTTNLLVQFGLAVRKKSGAAGNPSATVHVAVARSNG
ncbi:MAG: hypothetical protein KC621_18770 [Myxococcales bacterium]|nr:hypothetical protein [Myxococcales bacterium]